MKPAGTGCRERSGKNFVQRKGLQSYAKDDEQRDRYRSGTFVDKNGNKNLAEFVRRASKMVRQGEGTEQVQVSRRCKKSAVRRRMSCEVGSAWWVNKSKGG